MALKTISTLTSDERKNIINSLVPQLSDAERKELSVKGKLAVAAGFVETPDWSININIGCSQA